MKYGLKFTNIMRKSKFHSGLYQKPPKLVELHQELFHSTPNNLHNSLIDVLVCFRCFYNMVYEKDLFDGKEHPELQDYYNTLCRI